MKIDKAKLLTGIKAAFEDERQEWLYASQSADNEFIVDGPVDLTMFTEKIIESVEAE